jgi:FixJ family two-component response regulator
VSVPAKAKATVYVVDADAAVRDGLHSLLRLLEFNVKSFSSAEEILAEPALASHACIVTEIHLPGMNGLELQEELKARGIDLPIIVLAGRGDVALAVRALRGGAADFIEKPFVDRILTRRIREVLAVGNQGKIAR